MEVREWVKTDDINSHAHQKRGVEASEVKKKVRSISLMFSMARLEKLCV